jgi:hypothetical protein
MFGILIVQDLAVVPLMIVLPELSDPAGGLIRVGAAALQAFLLLGVIVLVATLGELQIRSTTGASVVGVVHGGSLIANPDGQVRLETGDLVAVLGTRDQIGRFEESAQSRERALHEV